MIKKFLSIGFAAIIGLSAIGQASTAPTIPTQVLNSFHAQHPAVTNPTWTEEAGYYLPTYTVNGVQSTGYIDLKGNYIQTIVKIAATDLPSAASAYIHQNYSGAQVSETGRIEFTTNHLPRYIAKVNGKQLLFDNTGAFIKITASTLKQ